MTNEEEHKIIMEKIDKILEVLNGNGKIGLVGQVEVNRREIKECKKDFYQHKDESVPIRDTVRDNKNFIRTAKWAIRIIYASIVGIIAKILFIK